MGVNRINKLTDLLPYNKRNKIIFKPPPDNHRNNYVRRNRDADTAQAPSIDENRRRNVRQMSKTENAGTRAKPVYKQR
jgi:hypothetical protein